MIIDLNDLFTKGHFGAISFGTSRDKVFDLMGKPQAWNHQKLYEKAEIWKYGNVEFSFGDNDGVNFIGVYFNRDSVLPDEVTTVGYFPSSRTNYEQFTRHLRKNEIYWQILPELTFGNQICLLIGDFCHVLFSQVTKKIESIQLAESLRG